MKKAIIDTLPISYNRYVMSKMSGFNDSSEKNTNNVLLVQNNVDIEIEKFHNQNYMDIISYMNLDNINKNLLYEIERMDMDRLNNLRC